MLDFPRPGGERDTAVWKLAGIADPTVTQAQLDRCVTLLSVTPRARLVWGFPDCRQPALPGVRTVGPALAGALRRPAITDA